MTTVLTQTERILTADEVQLSPLGVTYSQRDEDTGAARTVVALDFATVAELGDPHELTVTVRPGDHLNVED